MAGCGGSAPPPSPIEIGDDCAIVSVGSDYSSASLSILRHDGTLCAGDVLSSGSAPPGLVTALSGDVVLPNEPPAGDRLVVIDRFNDVITFVDGSSGAVESQVSVRADSATNPHDVVFVGEDRAWASRANAGDLVFLDVAGPAVTGHLDLEEWSDPGFDPRPDRFSLAGGRVWLNLNHLSKTFTAGGPGRLLSLDPTSEEVTGSVTLEAAKSCGSHDGSPQGGGLWVGCSGIFGEGEAAQLAASGLLWLDLSGDPTVTWQRGVTELGLDRPLAFSVAAESDTVAWAVVFGDLEDDTPDRLLRVDRASDAVEIVPVQSAPFQLGSIKLCLETGLLLVPDADPIHPVVRRVRIADRAELEPVVVSPVSGLPPRHLAHYR